MLDEIIFLRSNYDLIDKTKREKELGEVENIAAQSDGYGSDSESDRNV